MDPFGSKLHPKGAGSGEPVCFPPLSPSFQKMSIVLYFGDFLLPFV
jgi:hypothetical protein